MKFAPILSALIVFAITSVASAHSWDVAPPDTTPLEPADTAQLPYHATFNWVSPDPSWEVPNGSTWAPVWPRNAAGAWYRQNPYTQANAIKRNVYSWPYTCQVNGMGFRCLDKVRAIWRNIYCPSYLYMGEFRLWRSQSITPGWPGNNLFRGTTGPFWATTGRQLPVTGAVVTNNGLNINCQYGRMTVDGPGLTSDVWIFRR